MRKLKPLFALICALFVSAALYAQSASDEQPKGQSRSGASSQGNSSSEAGEQPKSAAQSGAAEQNGSQSRTGKQQDLSQQASPSSEAATEPVKTTVRGCIQAGNSRVTLTDSAGNTFLLRGDMSALKGEQHNVVEVTGQQLPPASRESAAAIPSIDVQSMRQIADTCPVHIYERSQAQPSGPKQRAQPNPATAPYGGPHEGTQNAPPDAVINSTGAGGAPSPGTGNNPPPPQTPPR
ncbi:MAG: hypothetical protein JO187_04050 [Acidobacteria bacterium]|nr:hypothetical protein [Acidobacteriota bacterium]